MLYDPSDELTHTIEISVYGNYPAGKKLQATVTMAGAGDMEHMLDAFKAALLASGFTTKVVADLDAKLSVG